MSPSEAERCDLPEKTRVCFKRSFKVPIESPDPCLLEVVNRHAIAFPKPPVAN